MLSVKVLFLCVLALGMVAAVGDAARAAKPVVVIETNKGTVKVELDDEKAPVTVKNFLDYVDAKHYDGLIFHRVIPTFMIQGGGMEPGLKERKTKPPIKNEAGNGLSNTRGTIAMARPTTRTAPPASSTSTSPTTPGWTARRPRTGSGTPSSAGSRRGWTWSTRSRR